MAESFSSRVVAVSGAAQAVGRAIAERFAEAGAKVYLIDRDEAALSAALKASGSVALRADPCDAGALEQAFSEIGRV
nr:SDR family NAD(P)-dependent oxidoreductase [Dehalococcoidales bacterium]